MTSLSLSANLAWQLSAREAAAARSEFIELPHILIGICSLEKISVQDEELSPSVRSSVAAGYAIIAPMYVITSQR